VRYRKLSATGDYSFGQGLANFWIDAPDGVAQSVQTRLGLWTGEWFLDSTEGTDYPNEVLGYSRGLYDTTLKNRILGTNGVTALVEYSSVVDPATRALSVDKVLINTQYSKTPIPVPPVVI
jgi:hypothetical protein